MLAAARPHPCGPEPAAPPAGTASPGRGDSRPFGRWISALLKPQRDRSRDRDLAERGTARRRGQGIGRAAVMIGVITVLARLVGFGRQVVFAHTVGTTCLGTAYTTANMVPNIIYDIVLGGALTSVVVPGARRRRLRRDGARPESGARRIASALLTWTVLLLVPVSAALALAAHPIVSVLLSGASGCPRGRPDRRRHPDAHRLRAAGAAVRAGGRAVRDPAVAPPVRRARPGAAAVVAGGDRARTPSSAWSAAPTSTSSADCRRAPSTCCPAGRRSACSRWCSPRWCPPGGCTSGRGPRCGSPPGSARGSGGSAIAGVAALVAQDASVAVVIVLANRYGASGSLVLYGFAWAVFVVPYAVLAVPIATSAFPELSATSGPPQAGGAASSTRPPPRPPGPSCSPPGSAPRCLVGAREPIARVFESRSASATSVLAARARRVRARARRLRAVGQPVPGAVRARAAPCARRGDRPAAGCSSSSRTLLIVPFVPAQRVVPVLGLGTTFGLTVSGIALLVLVRRDAGRPRAARGARGRSSPGSPAAPPAAAAGLGCRGHGPACPASRQRRPVGARERRGDGRVRRGRARPRRR